MRYASISSRAQLEYHRIKGAIMTVQDKEQKARLAKFDQEALRANLAQMLEDAKDLEQVETKPEVKETRKISCGGMAFFQDDKGHFLRWE